MRHVKSNLIEIKARVRSLEPIREKILSLGTRLQGTYLQTDTYFNTASDRLKMREVDGEQAAMLIYYDREDIPDPKQSDILIIETGEPETLKAILARSMGVKVTVEKTREIYQHQGTQVHLDEVEGLGTFIEFERPVTDLPEDRKVLESLMEELDVKAEDLVTVSYSDLKLRKA
jgi:predicted adenylyl cyclase CyaB